MRVCAALLLFVFASLFSEIVNSTAVQGQDVQMCRSLAMDCLMDCIQSSSSSTADAHRACKRRCIEMYDCSFSRDLWTNAKTDWCCACHGQRCPSGG
jgi:hypothetical protein